ncbi:hypothetical protein GCM10025734_73660 [Kitasatospora paranensis]
MTAVERLLSTNFCAVAALRRVEPAIASGPVSTHRCTCAAPASPAAGFELSSAVKAPFARAARSAPDVRGAAAGGDAERHVAGADHRRLQRAGGLAVLGSLGGQGQRARAARVVGHHDVRGQAEGGDQLGRVHDRDPARGAGAEVVQPAAGAQSARGLLHHLRQLGQDGGDGVRGDPVLRVEQAEHLEGRQAIDVVGARVAEFGG